MYINLEIEVYKENGKKLVFLTNDGSSGCKYEFDSTEELKQIINDYVAYVIDYGLDSEDEDEEIDEEVDERYCLEIVSGLDLNASDEYLWRDQLRSLLEYDEITEEEYDYILCNIDELVEKLKENKK